MRQYHDEAPQSSPDPFAAYDGERWTLSNPDDGGFWSDYEQWARELPLADADPTPEVDDCPF